MLSYLLLICPHNQEHQVSPGGPVSILHPQEHNHEPVVHSSNIVMAMANHLRQHVESPK